jgi:hypothetical protein
VLIGAVIFLSLVVLLLAMPLTLTYQCSWRQALTADFRLSWAFGLVRADASPDLATPEPDKAEAAGRRVSRWGRSSGRNANVMAAIRQSSFRRRMFRFVADVWRAIRKKDVRLRVRLGLGDPADTGQLWAALGPLSAMASRLPDIRTAIEPDFLDSTLEVDSSGTIRMIPLQLAGIVLGLLFSPAIWRGVMSMRASG